MIGLFGLGFAALVLATLDEAVPALVLLIVGFGAIAILDPIAARRGEAPLFFARLRPVQIPHRHPEPRAPSLGPEALSADPPLAAPARPR